MNPRYYIYPFLFLILSLSVMSCSDDDPEGRTPSLQAIQKVQSISLNHNSLDLKIGDVSHQLTATIYPTNATNKDLIWSSSNTNVATVSSSGVVTAKATGSATITATAADGSGKTATCSVTVKSGNSIDWEDYGSDNDWN